MHNELMSGKAQSEPKGRSKKFVNLQKQNVDESQAHVNEIGAFGDRETIHQVAVWTVVSDTDDGVVLAQPAADDSNLI